MYWAIARPLSVDSVDSLRQRKMP